MMNRRKYTETFHTLYQGLLCALILLALVVTSCCGQGDQGDSTTPETVRMDSSERADAARFECGRIDSTDIVAQGELDLSNETTEGGSAEVFRQEGAVVRIQGGLLGETFRFIFDYRYGAGELVCASETVTTMQTIYETEPEGPAPNWRFDFLFFDGSELLSQITERAPHDADPFHGPEELRVFAAHVFEMASSAGHEAELAGVVDEGESESSAL